MKSILVLEINEDISLGNHAFLPCRSSTTVFAVYPGGRDYLEIVRKGKVKNLSKKAGISRSDRCIRGWGFRQILEEGEEENGGYAL
jgi:hypothetical protein